ncbi:glycosyltransferase [Streptosporangium lutulentum]
MNIAFVSSEALSSSQDQSDLAAQRAHLLSIARELGRDHKVTIYTRRNSDTGKARVRVSQGVTLEHLSAGPAQDLPEDGMLPYLSDLGEQLMRRWGQDRPDVIHAHSWTGGLAAIAAPTASTCRSPRPSATKALTTPRRFGCSARSASGPARSSPGAGTRSPP